MLLIFPSFSCVPTSLFKPLLSIQVNLELEEIPKEILVHPTKRQEDTRQNVSPVLLIIIEFKKVCNMKALYYKSHIHLT